MDIVISNTSGDPIYHQIFDQISAQIIKGELKAVPDFDREVLLAAVALVPTLWRRSR